MFRVGVQGSGFRVQGSGFRVQGIGKGTLPSVFGGSAAPSLALSPSLPLSLSLPPPGTVLGPAFSEEDS
jgi:hypothetical protein